MRSNIKLTKDIAKLLKQTTSLTVVKEFLKSKNLHHSAGSWDSMLDDRLLPAVNKGELTTDDLITLLRDTEEYGHQHVFLYKCTKTLAAEYLDDAHLLKALRAQNIEELLENPRILDEPDTPTVSDVRHDTQNGFLTIKVIETRESREFLGEQIVGSLVTRQYRQVTQRAVNVMRLHRDGFVDVRITSHRNSSNYHNDVADFLFSMSKLLPTDKMVAVPISNAKEHIWNNRNTLHDEIRYSTTKLVNDNGTSLKVAAGSDEYDLSEDEGAAGSMEAFLDYDAYCDSANIYFVAKESGSPTNNIHVKLSGAMNEYAIPAHCAMKDYEHVLGRIRKFNK